MSRALDIWMNGEFVGQWRISDRGVHSLAYEATWINSSRARPISLSLPLQATGALRGDVVSAYFENLLPDNDEILKRLQTRYQLRNRRAFDLLSAIGRDCVGAVQLMPEGTQPTGVKQVLGTRLREDEIERHLRDVPTTAFGASTISRDFRISIAGAQEKTALLRQDGQWYQPQGTTPTTHILKLPLGIVGGGLNLSDSVENEWLCSKILSAFGLPVANCEMATFGAEKVLVVERFDRDWRDENGTPWIVRLPQEDFCQATGTPPTRKYESDGGPGIQRIANLLTQSREPSHDIEIFLKANLINWLLAAPDGHAKNFSLFLLPGGSYRLTPLYDVISAWPYVGSRAKKLDYHDVKLAMGLKATNKHCQMGKVLPRHWLQEVRRAGADPIWQSLLATIDQVTDVIEQVGNSLPANFPMRLWEAIRKGMLQHQSRFRSQPATE